MEANGTRAGVGRDEEGTARLADRLAQARRAGSGIGEGWSALARLLGAHPDPRHPGLAAIAIWTPGLVERGVPEGDVFIEVLEPRGELSLTVARQSVRFRRTLVPASRLDDVTYVAVRGMTAGTRGTIGTFYALVWRDAEGRETRGFDPLAASVPFGVLAPAELYDIDAMLADRKDAAHFKALAGEARTDGPPRVPPPSNILQVHVPTATGGGTLASLTRWIEALGERVGRGEALRPADRLLAGYDAVQLLPVEPTTVYEAGPAFWTQGTSDEHGTPDGDGTPDEGVAADGGGASGEDGIVEVDLRRPDTTNWGYDVVIAGSAAVNPVLLESGRPDELVDLAAALHRFPGGPIRLVLDVVFGHADNQALGVLDHHFLAGPNMYGQNLAFRNPGARAIMLEMQRRKVNFGADGVRVDGAQDFKWWDATARVMRHDDDYLREMFDVPQEAAGVDYRPWFVFEDGRPWPEEDWELASTYRAVTELLDDPDVFQWGPLTFAHNTPFLYTFWLSKLWRIRQIMDRGASWISGCSNHDTLRRGTQVDPELNVNTRLGATLMEILDKAYDNPAVQMFTYAACPGVPMDFLNASARASWGFVRNQDDRYGVKVVAEEAISLKWQVDAPTYDRAQNFRRLKAMGFATRDELRRMLELWPALVKVTGYDLDAMARLLRAVEPALAGPPIDVPALKAIARAWMDDMHDFVNVTHSLDALGDEQTGFNLALRELRRTRPWLRGNLRDDERFDYRRPVDGSVVFECLRRGPPALGDEDGNGREDGNGGGEELLVLTHMEGAPASVALPDGQWSVLLATPGLERGGIDPASGRVDLIDSTGIVLRRAVRT